MRLTSARAVLLWLLVLAAVGFGLRVQGIGRVGFAEDEINKLEAVRAYARGDITPNGEHPMLMKSLMFVSFGTAHWWNAHTHADADEFAAQGISDEAALRFPNILFGALTVVPLYLLTAAFFDRRTGYLAAAFWAVGVNAITFNRVAKEDTLLVFFMLFAFYFYLRAKQTSGFEQETKRKFYAGSAIAFGLMLASKYFPHFFGLNMLYHHLVPQRQRAEGEPRGRTPAFFYPLVALSFLVANPAVLLPKTWRYLVVYSSEQLLTHHGYLMGEHIYVNQMSATPFGGMPIYCYLLFLLIKTPPPLLIALVVGLVWSVRRWRQPGAAFLLLMFLLWIVPYSLAGAKWLRYSLSLMPFVYMLAAVGVAWVLKRCETAAHATGAHQLIVSRVAVAVVLAVFVGWPEWVAVASGPHHALYTNALADGRAGYYFPHDEFYDNGLREAIKYVCDHASPGATLAHETLGVTRYYLEKYERTDLQPHALSAADFDVERTVRPTYFILQRGRTYFENQARTETVRRRFPKVYAGTINGVVAVEVYVAE